MLRGMSGQVKVEPAMKSNTAEGREDLPVGDGGVGGWREAGNLMALSETLLSSDDLSQLRKGRWFGLRPGSSTVRPI